MCLQILESVVRFKWGALPMEQREGIKTYLSNLIIKYSTDEASFRSQHFFLGKLNVVLVQILKQVSLNDGPGAPQEGMTSAVRSHDVAT